MKVSHSLVFAMALLISAGSSLAETPAPVTAKPTLEQLAWLAGHWQGGSEGRVTEELWLPPAGDMMLGLNRDTGPSGKAFFEYLRLEQTDQGIFYYASPRGGQATSFTLVECTESKAVFEYRAHDFPQRISYRLTGPNTLSVTISGSVAGKTESRAWTWTRLSGVAVATGGETR